MRIVESIIAAAVCVIVFLASRRKYDLYGKVSALVTPYTVFVCLTFLLAFIINTSIAGR
jgi:hypothetical protein